MAVTANQLAVALFDAAAGGYKATVDAFIYAQGPKAAAEMMLRESGLNNADNGVFAYLVVDKMVGSTLTAAQKQAAADFLKAQLAAGQSRGDVVLGAIEFLLKETTKTDATYKDAAARFSNKIAAADLYQGSSTDITALKAAITNVTQDPATVSGAVKGTTFVLDSSITSTVGTTADDVFNAIYAGGAGTGSTFQLGDNVVGGSGNDVLNLTITANPAGSALADVSGVEKVVIRDLSVGATFNAALIAGAAELVTSASTANLAVTNLSNLVKLGVENTIQDLTVGFSGTVLDGAADTLTVSGNAAGGKTRSANIVVTNANKVEGLAIVSNGSATNYIDTTGVGNAVKTVTVTGDAKLDLVIDPTAVTAYDASAAKGGVKLTGKLVGTAAAGLSVKGGAGADTVTVDLANKAVVEAGAGNDTVTLTTVTSLTKDDSVKGGEGTDTLALAGTDAKVVAANADRAAIAEFEVLKLTGALNTADTFDISKFGINSLVLAGDVATVTDVTGFATGATVELQNAANQTAALNVGMKNATDAGTDSDALNIKLNANLVATNNFAVKLGVEGINVLNVSTADSDNADAATKAAEGYTLNLTKADNVTAINVTGDKMLSFTSGAATNALKTFDASALTGELTVNLAGFAGTQGVEVKGAADKNNITGTALADIITGGAKDDVLLGAAGNDKLNGGEGKDAITGGVGADVISGGAGVDTFTVAAGDSLVATADSITDLALGVGGDEIRFGATPATATNIKSLSAAGQANVTAQTTLAAAVTQAMVETSGAKIAFVFTYGSDTYLAYNDANDDTFDNGADAVIKITGVTGTLDATNIFVV